MEMMISVFEFGKANNSQVTNNTTNVPFKALVDEWNSCHLGKLHRVNINGVKTEENARVVLYILDTTKGVKVMLYDKKHRRYLKLHTTTGSVPTTIKECKNYLWKKENTRFCRFSKCNHFPNIKGM